MQRTLLAIVFLGGCSALVNPDPSQLGDPVGPMNCPTDCSDGVACTVDSCSGTVCVNERDDSLCADSERCDMVMGCIDASCTMDENCDDGLACNGVETCNTGRCQQGVPVACDDGLECTVDLCDDSTGQCSFETNDALCDDGVPCTSDSCSDIGCVNEPNDALCDDGTCFEGGVCMPDGCQGGVATICDDSNECTVDSCNPEVGCVSEFEDGDGDGFSPIPGCGDAVDCDDGDITRYPGAEEVCDMIDQDCDDNTDGCDPVVPDTCETAQLLSAPGDAAISVSGSFDSYAPNYSHRCSESRGADAVFILDVAPDRDYIIDTLGSAADTVLAVTRECGNWNFAGRGCNDDIVYTDNRQSRIFLRKLGDAPGSHQIYILLSQFTDAAPPDWVLNVHSIASPGLMCGQPFDISPGGAVVGYISPMAPAFGFTCVGNSLSKREHYFRAATTSNAEPRVRTWSDDFDHSVSHRRGCFAGDADCDSADAGDRAEISWRANRAEELILVDGADSSDGDFYTLQYEP